MDIKNNIKVTTPLDSGQPKLGISNISGTETISELFTYNLILTSPDDSVAFDKILGKNVTVTIFDKNTKEYYIDGIVSRIAMLEREPHFTNYHIELKPWLWELSLTTNCKIFQNKTVVDIIKAIFNEYGFTDFEDKTTGTYKERIYCVQYMETAFNFVSRLMEEEGIFYFFEHKKGKHTLILADDMDAHKTCANWAEAEIGNSFIKTCTVEQVITSNKYAVNDYNFETPSVNLTSSAGSPKGSTYRLYEYPAKYDVTSDGEGISKKRLEASLLPTKFITGESTYRTFNAGYKFKLKNHQKQDLNKEYVFYSVSINVTATEYWNSFKAFPADTPFRPVIKTPKPKIYGTQTAIVVGKSGEEIWTDKYGRIKIQFYWDQDGKNDENSSCWVRVTQIWAGKSWGTLFTPRIGAEVIVSFLEGDPDRPIITGTVYNAIQTVPYQLPSDMNKSTILTRSTKKGSAGNEIRFDDTKDSEELYVHAQKDMNTVVENQRTATIKESNEILTVEKGNRTIKVNKGNEDHHNAANFEHNVKGNYTLTIDGNLTISVKGSISLKGDKDISTKAGTSFTNEAGTTMENKASASMKNDGGGMMENKAGIIKLN